MAETFEQYEKNKAQSRPVQENRWMSIEDRMDVAMNQTELLKGVCARVKAFVEAYEGFMEFEIKRVKEIRENPEATGRARSIADNMELDTQTLCAAPDEPQNARLLLDDLKVLLDQMAEGYR